MRTLYTGTDENLQEIYNRLVSLQVTSHHRTGVSKFKEVLSAVSRLSKDPVKGVGSVLLSRPRLKLIATGYNGLPYGIPDATELLDPAIKNGLMTHSEINLIANAAELGVCTSGSILLCSKASCHVCALSGKSSDI